MELIDIPTLEEFRRLEIFYLSVRCI